ncbi:hypothetical protein [uncultured Paracoccus sp.]|uniref:hypothetical protein n=1 Tax=uncultured Paracoccus sp. TaxID=189685 RepID=UPI002636E996|nr:hypothetical protein [uncultured Paracoccus sp.]
MGWSKLHADLPGPRKLGPYPDRDLDCQQELEKGFLALVEKAELAGWVRLEIYAALIELIDHQATADRALESDDDNLVKAKRSQR